MLKSIDYLVVGRRRSMRSFPDCCHRWQVKEWGFSLLFVVGYLIDFIVFVTAYFINSLSRLVDCYIEKFRI